MNILALVARLLVGTVFIFSGLIKLNDPVGTQIKLEEYFEVFATDFSFAHGLFHALIPLALTLAVVMCVAEVVLGVALLTGYRPRQTTWALLALTVFFTFLTFYSAYFNKVTDCGCFGEAIKLKPWTSFGKDVVLIVLIGGLLTWQYRKPATTRRVSVRAAPRRAAAWATALATVLSVGLAVYAIRHLPPVDLLPYRVGANIPAQMKPSAPLRFKYVMIKNGQQSDFLQYPADTTYRFKEMTLLNPEATAKITDFNVSSDEGDLTQEVFRGNWLLLVLYDVKQADRAALPALRALAKDLDGARIRTVVLTGSDAGAFEQFRHENQLAVPYYRTDVTVLKTMVRANPGLVLLRDGTVRGKWHYYDMPTAADIKARL